MADRDTVREAALELQQAGIVEVLSKTAQLVAGMSLAGFGAMEPRLRRCVTALATCVGAKPTRSD